MGSASFGVAFGLFVFLSFSKTSKFGGGRHLLLELVSAWKIIKAWNSYCSAIATVFQTFCVCANTHTVLVSKLWAMAVVCSTLAWIWHEKRDCWKARSLEAWTLCLDLFFFVWVFFLIAFPYEEKSTIPCLLHWRYDVEAFLPLGEPENPVCSHIERWSDLKNEQFIVAIIRLTDCCGFLIYWVSVS